MRGYGALNLALIYGEPIRPSAAFQQLETSYGALTMLRRLFGGDLRQHRLGFLFREVLSFVRMVHRAELGTAHGAERRVLEALLGQGFIVVSARGFRIE